MKTQTDIINLNAMGIRTAAEDKIIKEILENAWRAKHGSK